jgi:hypothetical protein
MARFLDLTSSQYVLEDLVLLRPLASLFYSRLDEDTNDVLTHQFISNGKAKTESEIRSDFESTFLRFCHSGLLFSKYRQVANFLLRDHGISNGKNEGIALRGHFLLILLAGMMELEMLSAQMGHTIETDNRNYGRSSGVYIILLLLLTLLLQFTFLGV